MGKGGADTMPGDRGHRRSVLTKCKHCGNIVTFDWERTTADEFNATMGVQKGCNSPFKPLSQDSDSVPKDCMKRALERLKDEFGFGEPKKVALHLKQADIGDLP